MKIIIVGLMLFAASACAQTETSAKKKQGKTDSLNSHLTPLQYKVACEGATEAPFSGEYWNHKEKGKYHCVRCGETLFSSQSKFDSGTGWPSFTAPVKKESIGEKTDNSLGMSRTEITCKKCGAHLGHVFNDGPAPTGMRYCVNSASLKFRK